LKEIDENKRDLIRKSPRNKLVNSESRQDFELKQPNFLNFLPSWISPIDMLEDPIIEKWEALIDDPKQRKH
jgi:hypothetical protein